MTGPRIIKVKFENVIEVKSLIQATFVFRPELDCSSFMLVQGLFRLNRVNLGYDGPDDY